jgi:PAS domain S-box-containing protein
VRTLATPLDDDAPGATLFDLLPVGAYRSLPDGRQVRANAALVRLNGYDNEAEMIAAVGDIATEWYVDPTRRDEFRQRLERDGEVRGFVSEIYRHRTRERIWVSENAHVLWHADGRVRFYEGTVEDVTEHVRRLHDLEHSELRLHQISQHFPGVVFRTRHLHGEPTPTCEFVSDGVRDLYGVEPEQVMRDGGLLQRMRHPEDSSGVEAALFDAKQRGGPFTHQFRIVRQDGSVRWVQGTTALVEQGPDFDIRTGVVLDITAQREAAALRADRDRAEAARRATAALLSRVSHELRTPLNAVLGFAQLLQREPSLAARPREWAELIATSGRHLLALVDDVLTLASTDSRELQLQLEETDLSAALADCMAMLESASGERGIRWDLPRPPLPAVLADATRLRQVLANLLSNAVKYNRDHGTVHVTVAQAHDQVTVAVTDTGPGMTPAQCERLFQPFERLDAERRAIGGTGLGLALSRELAIAMGGSIDVASTPGKGSTFALRLPAVGGRPRRRD